MVTRVLHVSDLHFGAGDDEAIERGAPVLIERFAPELVIASGDLSHRGREDQLVRASRFLHGLDRPVLAIPGNHDIPYTFPARFTRSFQEFERQWETTEPTYSSPTLHVIGLNSVRPWRHQSGGVRTAQLERAEERLRDAAPGAFQIVVLHHHMIGAPWRSRKKPVARRNHVLASLVVPYQVPAIMFVSERGTLGEFNLGQALVCRTMRPVLDSLAMEHHTCTRLDEFEFIVDRSIKQALSTQAPVALILSPLLTGGKTFDK